jgi:hypothetical protein
MRKHILGFAVFNFIVISFGLVYAFIYVPAIPKRDEVKQPAFQPAKPVAQYDYRSSCWKSKLKQMSAEIISSNYYSFDNKVVSKIRVSANDASFNPKQIYLAANYSVSGDLKKDGFGDVQTIIDPFEDSRERVFTVVTRVPENAKIGKQDNMYLLFDVSEFDGSTGYKRSGDITQAKEVLFIHDKTR